MLPLHLVILSVAKYLKNKREIFRILTNAQNDKLINDLESQIDDLVYKLYELDSREIQIIESN